MLTIGTREEISAALKIRKACQDRWEETSCARFRLIRRHLYSITDAAFWIKHEHSELSEVIVTIELMKIKQRKQYDSNG